MTKGDSREMVSIDFHDLFEEKYKEYAYELIENRALIDSRDGLKPVNRRILWHMYDAKITDKGNTTKVSKISGAVMGNLHPHGNSSIEDALVRLSQDFSLRVPLIIGQGNFGDSDGNPAAAARYIEAKLSPAGMMLLEGTDPDIVEFVDNYDSSCQEPLFLASKFPNLLINGGGSGMAVAVAFKDCSHNPKEICDAVNFVLDNSDATIEDICSIVKGPDWNCGGYLIDNEEIKRYISTGRGSLGVLGKCRIDTSNGKTSIVIEELPYQYGRSQMMIEIAKEIKSNPSGILSNYISKFKDLSDMKNGTNIVIELKTGSSPQLIINELKSKTGFKQNISINMNVLYDGAPLQVGVLDLIKDYIKYRRVIVSKRIQKKIKSLKVDLSRSEALLAAIAKIDEVIETIKGSNNAETACAKLMKLLSIDEEQAKYILDIPLKRLTRLEGSSIKKDHEDLIKNLKLNEDLIKNQAQMDNVIKSDLQDVLKICDCTRKTKIIKEEKLKLDTKVDVEKESLYFMLNNDYKGKFIRKYNNDLSDKEKTTIISVKKVSNMDYVISLGSNSEYYSSRIYSFDVNNRNSNGNLLFNDAANISDILIFSESDDYLTTLTSEGKIKKSKLSDFPVAAKKPSNYIKLTENSSVVNNVVSNEECEYFIATDEGYIVRYEGSKIPATGRISQGVNAIAKKAGNPIRLLAIPVQATGQLVVFTENGYGKKIDISEIPIAGTRGAKGLQVSKLTKDTGKLADICYMEKEESILAMTNIGSTVSFEYDEIFKRNRQHKGDILIDMIMNQKISRIERITKIS